MKKVYLLCLSCLLLSSCFNLSISSSFVSSSNSSFEEYLANEMYDANYYQNITIPDFDFSSRSISSQEEITQADFFSIYNKIEIKIDIDENNLNKLEESYILYSQNGNKSEKYYHCNVTISIINNGNTFSYYFEDVGIRQKGNTSRKHVYQNHQIEQFHFKLSFDETFTDSEIYDLDEINVYENENALKERKNRNFLEMSGLDFKYNRSEDTSYVKEIFASKLYQANGIIVQDITLGSIKMGNNDAYTELGVYNIYEQANKELIKHHLQNQNSSLLPSWKEEKNGAYGYTSSYGDLYKCSYGHGEGKSSSGANMEKSSYEGKKVGVNSSNGDYLPTYNKKTNKDEDHHYLMETLDIINDEDDLDILNQYVDLKYFAIEEAISYFIGSSDDLRNNNNNYLIYIRKSDRKMMIIPYDFDYCFGQGSSIWNPSSMAMSQNEMFSLHAYGSNQEISNSLFLKTILNENQVNIYQAYYLNTLKALKVSSFIQEATFNHLFEIYQNNYQNDSLFGFSLNNDENMSYQTYLNNKLKMIDLSLSLKNTSSQVKNNYVYLSLNQNQWNQVGIYTWNGLDLGSWPGKKMSYDETLGYYYYKMGKNVSCNVIFNNYQVGENSLQTEDLYYSSYNLFTLNYADNQENKLSGTWSKI